MIESTFVKNILKYLYEAVA